MPDMIVEPLCQASPKYNDDYGEGAEPDYQSVIDVSKAQETTGGTENLRHPVIEDHVDAFQAMRVFDRI